MFTHGRIRRGIIVECTLKLRPVVQGVVATIGAFFDSVELAAGAAASITAEGHAPAIMELMDGRTLECVGKHIGENLLAKGSSYFLVQCDGPEALDQAHAIAEIIRGSGGTAALTADPEESARLVDVRRLAFPALESLGKMLVEDIAVARDRMQQAFAKIAALEKEYGLIIPTSCHAGDGNLHPTFVYEGEIVPKGIWLAAGELFSYALELGGTLTGEHGVGLLKRNWLEDELGPDQLLLQKGIKSLFDPSNILNPGKVFTP